MRRAGWAAAAIAVAGLAFTGCTTTTPNNQAAAADQRNEINAGADATLSKLYTASPQAKDLVQRARGVLVFLSVMGASFIVGGEHGRACCARAARMRATTAPPAVRWDCRRGHSRAPTCCCS